MKALEQALRELQICQAAIRIDWREEESDRRKDRLAVFEDRVAQAARLILDAQQEYRLWQDARRRA